MKGILRIAVITLTLLALTVMVTAGLSMGAFSTTGSSTIFIVQSLDNQTMMDPPNPVSWPEYFKFYTEASGVADGDDGWSGSFQFQELGFALNPYKTPPIVLPSYELLIGANAGEMQVSRQQGQADFRFGGRAFLNLDPTPPTESVAGSYEGIGGTGAFSKNDEAGTYAGNAGFVFTVTYQPYADFPDGLDSVTAGDDRPDVLASGLPAIGVQENDLEHNANSLEQTVSQCAVFTSGFQVEDRKVKWEIRNAGHDDLVINQVYFYWPQSQVLEEVKLLGTILEWDAERQTAAGIPEILPGDDGWQGGRRSRTLKAGEVQKLEFKFSDGPVAQEPWEYTAFVLFESGCAIPYVAMAPL